MCFSSQAQKRNKPGLDSLQVKGRSYLILSDTTIYVKRDTVFYLPDSVVSRLRKDREGRSSEVYSKIKEKLSKKKLTKEIYKIFFRDNNKSVAQPKVMTGPTDDFEDYDGKFINTIYVKRLNPFGTRVTDTTRYAKDWFSKAGNKIHINTKEYVIRNNLFFKEGDEVDSDLLRDTERILRALPFLRDARVFIVPKENSAQVGILVITRDVWNISGSFSYDDPENFDITVTDKNFLGLGYEFENRFPYSTRGTPNVGYIGTYTANNIKSTFITGRGTFARSLDFDRSGIELFRNFITPEIKYAGGIEVAQERRTLARVFRDTTILFSHKFNIQDYWFGRSYLVRDDETGKTNFQIAVNHEIIKNLDRPVVTNDTNQNFYDNRLTLFSLGLSKRRFDRSALVLGYGRTEDIPIGYLAELTVGRDNNEFTNRTYFGADLSYGKFFYRVGYLRPTVSFGSFFENKRLEQGVFNLRLDYFSLLYRLRRTSFRQFITLRYVNGIRRFDDEFININDQNGVRGLSDIFLRGTKKLNLKAETVAFTPFFFAGFRMAFYGFVDLALIDDVQSRLFDNTLYQGYGIGFRFRNENLAFNTIQLRLAWYPNTTPGVSSTDVDFSGSQSLNIPDFRVDRPAVLTFD